MSPPLDPHRRFAERTVRQGNGCLLWTGAKSTAGYPMFRLDGKPVYVHRWSLEQKLGRPIREGMGALHHCDTPACVNPSCLFEGTTADNMADKNQKNRQARGERNGSAKLTVDEVIQMRADHATGGYTERALAAKYGVTHGTAGPIIRRQTWRHC